MSRIVYHNSIVCVMFATPCFHYHIRTENLDYIAPSGGSGGFEDMNEDMNEDKSVCVFVRIRVCVYL